MLDLGIRPEVPLDKWALKIHGLVENPVTLNWDLFKALPQFKDVSDFHCVTTWSQFDMEFEGVAFFTIADLVKPRPEATHVFFKSHDGYSTNNPLDACMDDDVLIAHSWNGQPLTKEHGGPARVILPKRYAWKGAKFIRDIQFSNLGNGPEGITAGELTKKVLSQVNAETLKAVEKAVSDLGKQATDLLKGAASEETTKALDKATKGIGDLFKKKQ